MEVASSALSSGEITGLFPEVHVCRFLEFRDSNALLKAQM